MSLASGRRVLGPSRLLPGAHMYSAVMVVRVRTAQCPRTSVLSASGCEPVNLYM
jgi:hypothetical protein